VQGRLLGGLVPPVRDGFVPRLRRAPGFRSYCAFASEDGHVVSVTIFADPQTAMRADDRVREWVVSSLRDLLPNPPEVDAGETLLHEESKRQSGGPGMYATIRACDGVGPKEEVLPRMREHVFLMITGAPGLRGYYAFLDERDASRGVSVSLYDTREHAAAANERFMAAMRDKRIAPNPRASRRGRVAIIAAIEQ
jgi:hypothetical protein